MWKSSFSPAFCRALITLTGMPERGPDVVVVDAGRHDVDQHLVVADRRDVDDLLLERRRWAGRTGSRGSARRSSSQALRRSEVAGRSR